MKVHLTAFAVNELKSIFIYYRTILDDITKPLAHFQIGTFSN